MFLNNKLLKGADKLKALFLDLIFPIECLGCSREGIWLCQNCFRKLEFKARQYCLHCKQENQLGQFCPQCQSNYYLDGIWIAAFYDQQIIAKMVKSLKYRFAQDIARDLGKFLSLFLRDLIYKSRISRADLIQGIGFCKLEQISKLPQVLLNFSQNLIVPVPLSSRRRRWRGFNQAEVIANSIASHFNLALATNKLIRIKHKKPQAKLGEAQRKNNIINCFSWQDNRLAGENIIVVDDVVTTGATLNECAKVLKANGAGEVWGLVVAKG